MDHTLRLIQHNWIILPYNFNIVILVLIIEESSICAFLLTILLQFCPCYYLALPFYSCTCWVPTISVLNLAIFPCYSNLLLRKRRWIGILQRGVLGYMLSRLSFLCNYGVFHCSVSLRVIIIFRDITYVIIILYSWHLVICKHFCPYVWNNWSWVMHTMSTWFWHKNRAWQPFFSGAVDLFKSVDGYTKGCYTWTTWDMYGREPYADWVWKVCGMLVGFSPAGCTSIRISATLR
jgi:hypothetical protein